MKAISLWQPWASLVAIGAKQYETRHWPTDYRGPLIIHAAKRWQIDQRALCHQQPFLSALLAAGYTKLSMVPFGAYLCIVDLVDVLPTGHVVDFISDQERAFGDYGPRRFAWKLENVRRFPAPILARGYQGFWDPMKDIDPAMRRLIENLGETAPALVYSQATLFGEV